MIAVNLLFSCKSSSKNMEGVLEKEFFVEEDSINLGRLSIRDSISIYYALDNLSNREIKIMSAGSSCGCSEVNIGDSVIKAKETKRISVKFLTADTGKFNKSVVLETNAAPKYKVLHFYGSNFY
ncbi:DUF1573 domain-containing protein [Pedobacter sp.]